MITNIRLTGMYNIGVNDSNNIDVNGTNVSLKDIPFIRYAFEKYGVDELNYIKQSIKKFAYSANLVELKLNEYTDESLSVLGEILEDVAKFIYIDITQQVMDENKLDADVVNRLVALCKQYKFDRIMLVDKTTNMDMVSAKKFMKELSVKIGYIEKKIGICSSPLCMTDNLACLTAERARELAAMYAKDREVVSPSANHQDMNCCGCMRYFTVTSDIAAPVSKVKAVKAAKEKSDKPKNKTLKKNNVFTLSNYI